MDYSFQHSGCNDNAYGHHGNHDSTAPTIRFADLFAGLGGFHVGLSKLGMQCVFASELDEELRGLYQKNFGLLPEGDIRSVDEKNIPAHDILCAGFPCQPFSVAGKKKGAACPASGKLINDVLRIAAHHLPNYILLENVPNILTIQNGEFWNQIKVSLGKLGYEVDYRIYSPHEFGIPQKRERVFVVASRIGLKHFSWPSTVDRPLKNLNQLVRDNEPNIRKIEPAKLNVLEKWQQLLGQFKDISSHTIIASEFGATYPLGDIKNLTLKQMRQYNGAFGAPLADCKSWAEVLDKMPHYIKANDGKVPAWIASSLTRSRVIYLKHQTFIDNWKIGIIGTPNSWQKLEWRGRRDKLDIWLHTIQFRASGIRIMQPNYAPSLVAMTPTQTPIIGFKKRYMGVREAASLQSLESLKEFPDKNGRAFKALGNAVNAFIVGAIVKNLI